MVASAAIAALVAVRFAGQRLLLSVAVVEHLIAEVAEVAEVVEVAEVAEVAGVAVVAWQLEAYFLLSDGG